jgi:hypothetical protein
MQLLEYLNDITETIDDGRIVDVLYIDFQKAFDKVPHKELLYKLQYQFGIQGELPSWIDAYLTDRRQCVRVSASYSSYIPVLSGVPQGSVLGPLLFLLYVEDLDDVTLTTDCRIYKFADDTKITAAHARGIDKMEQLQIAANKLAEWTHTWKMPINVKKSQVIRFGLGGCIPEYMLEGAQLEISTTQKDLGVFIDQDLKFHQHVDKIVSQAMRLCGWAMRTFYTRKSNVLLMLYKSIIRPRLEYASVIWNTNAKMQIKKIEKVQKWFTKRLAGMKKMNYSERLQTLQLESLVSRRRYLDLLHVRNAISNKELFTLQSEATVRSLRGHNFTLFKPRSATRQRQNFFTNRVIDDWNRLPTHVISAISKPHAFRVALQKHIFEYSFVSD